MTGSRKRVRTPDDVDRTNTAAMVVVAVPSSETVLHAPPHPPPHPPPPLSKLLQCVNDLRRFDDFKAWHDSLEFDRALKRTKKQLSACRGQLAVVTSRPIPGYGCFEEHLRKLLVVIWRRVLCMSKIVRCRVIYQEVSRHMEGMRDFAKESMGDMYTKYLGRIRTLPTWKQLARDMQMFEVVMHISRQDPTFPIRDHFRLPVYVRL